MRRKGGRSWTGGGARRGQGHCLNVDEHGAHRWCERPGSATEPGTRATDVGKAQQVVNEIKDMGGEAGANGDDVFGWNGSKHMIEQAIENIRPLDATGVLNARHPARNAWLVQNERGQSGTP